LRVAIVLLFAAVQLFSVFALLGRHAAHAHPPVEPDAGPAGFAVRSTALAQGDPLPRIQCARPHTVTVYAEGLSSPDGLAFSPDGVLYVAEEGAGRVSQVGPGGTVTPVINDLSSPEGIAFDGAGNLYVVEDIPDGRVVKRTPGGATSTLAAGFEAPEGVVWSADGTLYVTESTVEFASEPEDLRTRIAAISPSGAVTRIITSTPVFQGVKVRFWSYAGLAVRPDGRLYVTNELSGIERTMVVIPGMVTLTLHTTDSVFSVDPATGARTLFVSDLISPEGLRFSASDGFPLYVAEEDVEGGAGRLSQVMADGSHAPLCTGFESVEDVAVDGEGRLYVSEDTSGLVIRLEPGVWYDLAVAPVAQAGSGAPGAPVTYTVQVSNLGNVSDTFDVSVAGPAWPTTAPASAGPLTAGTSASVDVTVDVPLDGMGGEVDTAVITFTSRGDGERSAGATLTTTVNVVRGVVVKGPADSRLGEPGEAVTHTLQVTNTGNLPDAFDLSASGHTWPVAVPAPVGPLGVGARATVVATVTIPADAMGGATDVVTLTFTSQEDGATWAAVPLTTGIKPRLFLPLVLRRPTGW